MPLTISSFLPETEYPHDCAVGIIQQRYPWSNAVCSTKDLETTENRLGVSGEKQGFIYEKFTPSLAGGETIVSRVIGARPKGSVLAGIKIV